MSRIAVRLPDKVFEALQRQAARANQSRLKADDDMEKLQSMMIAARLEGGWPLQAIADAVGVSRARVHQVVTDRAG